MLNIITSLLLSFIVSVYSLQLPSINGNTIQLADYAGKKILFVNIATGSQDANQLTELEQFYDTHKDSIVVIGLPSNSFNNETNTDDNLGIILSDSFHITFPVAAISPVDGDDANSIFKWLASEEDNGVVNAVFKRDFQKFLLHSNGAVYGIFSNEVHVTDSTFQKAILLTNSDN